MLLDYRKLVDVYNMNVTGMIHIGGHFGDEYDVYKEYDSIKHMLFFEPDEDSFKKLEEKTKGDPRVICVERALGPFSCKMEMHKETGNNGQSNSLLEPHLHITQYPKIVFEGTYEVKVHPLDKYEPSKVFNMINIDVQGFELEVFRGAKKTLNNIQYVMTEVNRAELYKNCCMVEELDEFLGKYSFERKETTWEGQTWGDALYIKNETL